MKKSHMKTPSEQTLPPITANTLQRFSSQALFDARRGMRTPITLHGKVVAAIVSIDDLKTLEDAS
jgi:antitoxin (DNA-binding transcriptional repressor) of toxin-antitoxin stability system